jgi:hypothetical protein
MAKKGRDRVLEYLAIEVERHMLRVHANSLMTIHLMNVNGKPNRTRES